MAPFFIIGAHQAWVPGEMYWRNRSFLEGTFLVWAMNMVRAYCSHRSEAPGPLTDGGHQVTGQRGAHGQPPGHPAGFCDHVSPLTPMGVAGVIWVPGQVNFGYSPADYSPELEIYARSLPATYGQEKVPFLHAQPSATLVPGMTPPKIANAKSAEFDQWPKSLKTIATQLGAAAK